MPSPKWLILPNRDKEVWEAEIFTNTTIVFMSNWQEGSSALTAFNYEIIYDVNCNFPPAD